jgi:hypothetical protein
MSALASACRHLFGNPDPAVAVRAWPMQHPELAVLLARGHAGRLRAAGGDLCRRTALN